MSNDVSNSATADASRTIQHRNGPIFPLGQVVATPAALECCAFNNISLLKLIERHSQCDWGDLCEDDRVANVNALFAGGRILSAYFVGDEKLYCITEWDRSVTTLLRSVEY